MTLFKYITNTESEQLTNMYEQNLHKDLRHLPCNGKISIQHYFASVNVNFETYDNLQPTTSYITEDM